MLYVRTQIHLRYSKTGSKYSINRLQCLPCLHTFILAKGHWNPCLNISYLLLNEYQSLFIFTWSIMTPLFLHSIQSKVTKVKQKSSNLLVIDFYYTVSISLKVFTVIKKERALCGLVSVSKCLCKDCVYECVWVCVSVCECVCEWEELARTSDETLIW